MNFTDPGDSDDFPGLRPRRKRKGGPLPPAPSLFDISDEPPPTPFQVKSPTSKAAASEIREETKAKRRDLVYDLVKGSPKGLARFQLASLMDVPDHWCSSSVDALIKMGRFEEHPTATAINPKSGKTCAIVIAVDRADMEGAA